MNFSRSDNYIATRDLILAVNAAITLQRPLLIKGEPDTGKTMLAKEITAALKLTLFQWHVKSTTKSEQGLYEYNDASRLRDSQLDEAKVVDIGNYIVKDILWEAFPCVTPSVVLIDEIDKADIEFSNELLRKLDRMEFFVYETQQMIQARQRTILFITSNNEKELPNAFFHSCFFHYIKFPDKAAITKIVDVYFPGLKQSLLRGVLEVFFDLCDIPGLKKNPRLRNALISSNFCWPKISLPRLYATKTRKPLSRRCTVLYSKTNRTFISLNV